MSSHRFAVETAYLYPRADLPVYAKLVYTLRMARRIWRGGFDTLVAYQSTASILVGIVGWLAGCRLRVVHQTSTPSATPRPLRALDKLAGTLGFVPPTSSTAPLPGPSLRVIRPVTGAR